MGVANFIEYFSWISQGDFGESQKIFLISFRNILCPQQMFPRLLAQENIMSKCVHNNVSNLVNGLAHHESVVAQWLKHPTGIWEAMGSIPVGTQIFLCPTLVTKPHAIFINVDKVISF